jgi:TonB-linked SusC/RagA family outer membrane protein
VAGIFKAGVNICSRLNFANVVCLIICLVCFAALSARGQERLGTPLMVRGKITVPDESPGGIYIRSKTSGTGITDSAGNFSRLIRVLPDTLRFSKVGFFAVVRILRNVKDIQDGLQFRMMPEVSELAQVEVNTGYQRVKPNEMNGAVSVVDEKMLNARTGTNVLDRLIGQSSGLLLNTGKTNENPQNRTGISVRGLGTISGPLDPLIVLDGFIYDGDINNINPFDIESVSILKDAAAASIWGARAGNGVIVLSSKKARLNQSLNVSFNANATISSLPNLDGIPQMSTSDRTAFERVLFDMGYYNNRINNGYSALSPAVQLYLDQRSGRINADQVSAALDRFAQTDIRQEWLREFYTHALTQQYGLAIREGTGKHAHSVSSGFDRVVDESFGKSIRGNLRLTEEININPKLSISTSLYLNLINTASGRPKFGAVRYAGMPSYAGLRDESGNPLNWPQAYRQSYTDTAGMGRLLNWNYYPTEEYKHVVSKSKRKEIMGTVSLRYRILDFLNVEASYQQQRQTNESTIHSDAESYLMRNLVNGFSQLNRVTGVVRYILPKGGSLRTDLNEVNSYTARFQMNLNRTIGVSSLSFLAGAEARQSRSNGSGNTLYGYQEDPLGFVGVDQVNPYPNFVTGSNEYISSSVNLSSLQNRFVSLYANGAYAYRGKYRVSGSIRRDGSNVFGLSTNDKWNPLWSAGLGWVIDKELFYDVSWLPKLNISATYGYSGNVDLSRTASATGAYASNSLSPLPYVRLRGINNPELRWEQLSQVSLKLDFSFARDVLTGSFSVYKKHGTDLYGSFLYDYTTWGNGDVLTRNVADMEGKGFDLELHGRPLAAGKLTWTSDLYLSYNQSKTIKYYSNNNNLNALLGGGSIITPVVGKPLYAISAYKWGGLDVNGNPQGFVNGALSTDYNAISDEGFISGNNISYVGPANPLYFGSLINSVAYRNFLLSFNIGFKLGYFMKKSSINYYGLASGGTGHPDYALRWQAPGDEGKTNVPSFAYPIDLSREFLYENSEINVIPADHIRLEYINLAYHINAQKWRFPFRSLDMYVNTSNVGIIYRANKFRIDPDYNDQVPPSRTLTFGIRGSF